MNEQKKCIINFFSPGREDYKKGTERFVTTAKLVGFSGDIIVHSPGFTENKQLDNNIFTITGYPVTEKYGKCKEHTEEPYQFKSFAFQQALEMGYEKILWCDSSVMLFRNPEHYFKLSHETGIILFDNPGCLESVYTSDDCLDQMGCSYELANTFFQIDAAIMLLDFTYWKTQVFFDDYVKYCTDGICLNGKSNSNRPEFKAHRHDQSVASYIAKKHYINTINYGGWAYWGDDMVREINRFRPTFAKVGVQVPLQYVEQYVQIER
jgi:hypothetical protein